MIERFYGTVVKNKITRHGDYEVIIELHKPRVRLDRLLISYDKDPCFEHGDFVEVDVRGNAVMTRSSLLYMICNTSYNPHYVNYRSAKEEFIGG